MSYMMWCDEECVVDVVLGLYLRLDLDDDDAFETWADLEAYLLLFEDGWVSYIMWSKVWN